MKEAGEGRGNGVGGEEESKKRENGSKQHSQRDLAPCSTTQLVSARVLEGKKHTGVEAEPCFNKQEGKRVPAPVVIGPCRLLIHIAVGLPPLAPAGPALFKAKAHAILPQSL